MKQRQKEHFTVAGPLAVLLCGLVLVFPVEQSVVAVILAMCHLILDNVARSKTKKYAEMQKVQKICRQRK